MPVKERIRDRGAKAKVTTYNDAASAVLTNGITVTGSSIGGYLLDVTIDDPFTATDEGDGTTTLGPASLLDPIAIIKPFGTKFI